MKTLILVKYGFLIIGIGMLVGGLSWYQSVRTFVREASLAQGTVTDLVRSSSSSSSGNSSTYHPVVQYSTQSGDVVMIDRNNPKKYYMDLSFLPKLAG